MILKLLVHKNKFFIFFLFFFSIIVNKHFADIGVFPLDSFLHFDNGYRILNGEIPFSDFWIVSGLTNNYIQAIFFKIFGVNWNSYVLHASLINSLITLSTFFVLKNFKLETNYCFFYSLLFSLLAYPSSGTPFVDHHSAFFSLLGFYSLLMAINNHKKIYWVLMPVLMGLAFFSKQVPAAYAILSLTFILILYSYQNKTIDYLKYSLIGTFLFIFFILILGRLQEIKINSFFDQYIFYSQTVGSDRFKNFDFTFRGVIDHFKFIYIASLPLIYVIFIKIFKDKKYFKTEQFYISLSILLFTICLILHQLLTKNQTFVFFVIPLLTAFSHISIKNTQLKNKNYITLIIILFCVFATAKYHLSYNEKRKFHELANVNLELSTSANKIHNKLNGLNWISPEFGKNSLEEIDYVNQIQSYIKKDKRKKMVLTHYSFFSAILGEKLFSPSFAYTLDGTTHPIKGNQYAAKYKQLIIDIIKKNNIKAIYIAGPLENKHIYYFFNKNCFNEVPIFEHLTIYELNNCKEISG